MQRLSAAFRFIDLSFRMAQKHEALQRPWMFLSLGGAALTVLYLVPLGVLILGLGSQPLAWVLIGLILSLYLLSLAAWGEITALQTANIFAGLIQQNDAQKLTHPETGLFANPWLAVLIYVVAAPGLTLLLGFRELISRETRPDQAWIKAHPLIPPILALEGGGLKEAVERVKEIVAENYLRFQPGFLPVGWVVQGAAWAAFLIGAAAGALIAGWVADPMFTNTWRAFAAVGVGLAVLGIFSLGGLAFSTFFRTCYHTALYVWALSVEANQRPPSGRHASPPDILNQALTKKPKEKKEGSDAAKT